MNGPNNNQNSYYKAKANPKLSSSSIIGNLEHINDSIKDK